MVDLLKTGRLTLIDGDQAIGPDMHALQIPGHTPATMGADAAYCQGQHDCRLRWCRGASFPRRQGRHAHRHSSSDINPGSRASTSCAPWLLIQAIFPGHDSLMTTAFPKVADGITKLA